MDNKKRILYAMLDMLLSENDLGHWNLHPQKNGAIMLKVKFFEAVDTDKEHLNRSLSFKKLSGNQCKRNYLRAKSFREKQPEKTRKLSSELSEIPRNEEFSTPAPKFDPSDCFDSICGESSPSRIDDTMVTVDSSIACNSSPSKPDSGSSCALAKPDERNGDVSETKLSIVDISNNQPTPFDSDTESDYDDNAPHMTNWQEYRRQCTDLNCHYNPEIEIGHPDLNKRWGLRPNGTFGLYLACALCGKVICSDCVWIRRRHFHHRYHVNWYSRNNPPEPISVKNLIAGIF